MNRPEQTRGAGILGRPRFWLGVLLALLLTGGGLTLSQLDWTPTDTLFQQAQTALDRHEYDLARQLGQRLLARSARRVEGLLIVAESTAKLGEFKEALDLLSQVPRQDPVLSVTAKLMTARIQCDDLCRPADAERTLKDVLQIDPDSLVAHETLAFVLGLSGRSWEAAPHRLLLIQQDQFSLHHLSLLALGSTAAENPDVVEKFARTSPDDVLVKCALARIAMREDRNADAERVLDEVIQSEPGLLAAQAWRGELLLNRKDEPGLLKWHAGLPDGADEYPDIWFIRGSWAILRAEPRVAVRCLWECLRRDPCHHTASYALSNVLSQLNEQASAEVFRKHARLLGDLVTAAKTVEISGSPQSGRRAAVACDALGMRWEARAWRDVLRRTDPRYRPRVEAQPPPDPTTPRVELSFDPTRRVNLAAFPLPNWTPRVSPQPGPKITTVAGDSRIAFAEVAEAAGIKFTYHNASRPETESEYMYEFSGGGVAVLDYDLDGWPDLHFTEGSDSPPYLNQTTRLDCLYRNSHDDHFGDVTAAARIQEVGFSQGCTVGDFDNDGFPDLFVANIGPNRFYHNNGDGTFSDITAATGTAGDRWTTSCVLADFNGDGLPDLLAVNYLEGKELFKHPCQLPSGSSRLCTPHEFPAADDQLFVNLGDGRFEDQSKAAGIEVPEGKGLGVVAASFDGSGRLSLFVANDAVPNFFLSNVTPSRGAPTRFEERGFLSGLAVDADGQSQACMGVASGDANGDGLLDLFVTNFRNESNTLYVQQPGGGFVDDTRPSGLREPSFAMLGFGTQFLDADLDGNEDLVVTNGHVGNLKHHGIPYEMPPQFFHNLGHGRFAELPPQTVGSFFAGKYLGRGLARLDWNRDGREEFAISHLKSNAALLANQTPDAGNFLAVQLRGVESDRDAIGSIVTVNVGGRKLVRHLAAGDGYQASNQRQLVFGLRNVDRIERLEVSWPTGRTQTFSVSAVNAELLLIEGRAEPIVMR